jgi:hypothetical protein
MVPTMLWGRVLVLLGRIPAPCRSPERLFVNLIEGGGGRDPLLLVQLRMSIKQPQLVNISVKELTAFSLSMLDILLYIHSCSGSGAD